MNSELFVEDSFALTPNDVLLRRRCGRPNINYWLDDPNNLSSISVSIGGREPQVLNLDWVKITYGERAYFECPCGHRAFKLYLPTHAYEFKCRKCHKLQYQLSAYNRYSVAGRALYKMNRLQKLVDSRASMGRILYNGNYSKRFESFLRLCDRAGLDDIVQGARNLKELIKG